MSEQAKAGHVGDRVHCVLPAELRADAVELSCARQHFGVALPIERSLAQGIGVDADTDRLSQDQRVTRARAGVAAQLFRPTAADDRKTVDRLRGVDRVAAGDRNAGTAARFRAAGKDVARHFDRQLAERDTEDRKREQRRPAHRVDIADRIGGGDPTKIMRVVDDGHEEIRSRDRAAAIGQLPHRSVVGGLGADEELRKGHGGRRPRQ